MKLISTILGLFASQAHCGVDKIGQACQDDSVEMRCHGRIKVVYAEFGYDDTSQCDGGYDCNKMEEVTSLVANRCDGAEECDYYVAGHGELTDAVGDPCPNLRKFLRVQYKCEGTVLAEACEMDSLAIKCNGKINILNAKFGNDDPYRCDVGGYDCNTFGDVTSVFKDGCHGKDNCDYYVAGHGELMEITGDVCPNLRKFVRVEYTCDGY